MASHSHTYQTTSTLLHPAPKCCVFGRKITYRLAQRRDTQIRCNAGPSELRDLGSSDLKVSRCCLGTMTWGSQNSISEAHEQLSYALDQGINFIDTAEVSFLGSMSSIPHGEYNLEDVFASYITLESMLTILLLFYSVLQLCCMHDLEMRLTL